MYTGQTTHLAETRVIGHHQYICLCCHEKSAVAEHSINMGHHNQLQDISILAKNQTHELDRLGVTEVKLHPNNMNREGDFS
jgi:hypothetical protein